MAIREKIAEAIGVEAHFYLGARAIFCRFRTLFQLYRVNPYGPGIAFGSLEVRAERDEDLDAGTLLPPGSIVPEGGFAGDLPDDETEDAIFKELYPDPCDDPGAVQKLPGIVIGRTLKENLEAELGDCVQVTSPTIGYTFTRGAIRAPVAKRFRVIAVFDAGFDQYDSKLVYTDLYEAQAFYDSGDSVTEVEHFVFCQDVVALVSQVHCGFAQIHHFIGYGGQVCPSDHCQNAGERLGGACIN